MSNAGDQNAEKSMQGNPGPGAYASENHKRAAAKTIDKRVRGQIVKFAAAPVATGSAAFKS
jgi:hypothetical protein